MKTNNSLIKFRNYGSVFDKLTNDIFNDVFSDPFFAVSRNWRLESDKTTDKEYIFEVELPRFKKSEISTKVVDNYIVIEAKNDRSQYSRSIYANDLEADKAQVKLENGVLTLTIPRKALPEPKTKVLEIQEVV